MTEEQKTKAVELMKKLDIYEEYIKGFKKESKVCLFEGYGGFYIDKEKELGKKLLEIETEHNCAVYAVTHEFTDFGELYSFLIVTAYPEEWDELVCDYGNRRYIAFAYVWNKSDDLCSEFGSIGVQSFGGGIKRYA